MDNTYENISTCITIVQDNVDDLKNNIVEAINANFVNRIENVLGIKRKCPNVIFRAGDGDSINVNYNVTNSVGDFVREVTLANISYTYDTTNIYLSYDYDDETKGYKENQNINKYSVLLCFTTTNTISGFTILNPSMLIDNGDNTYSIRITNANDSVITFTQEDAFKSYDTILEQGLNPDNIDFNNLYIRNKLINNPNCYYELDFTDLVENDTIKSIPYIIDRLYDITQITSSFNPAQGDTIDTYNIVSVLSNTRVNYSITDYPVLFPKTIVANDDTIKGYLEYIYDIPTQRIDTGDSINNLYSGQLINLEDSQYVLCDANTVVQIDNLIITATDTNTTYTGRFHNFNILYPKNANVKVFSTLISDPTNIITNNAGEPLTRYNNYLRTNVDESIHSWYRYDSEFIEYSGVNAGNYDYLYKVCVPNTDIGTIDRSTMYATKEEYIRLHQVAKVADGTNIVEYIPYYGTNNGYMCGYTTMKGVIYPMTTSTTSVQHELKVVITLNQISTDAFVNNNIVTFGDIPPAQLNLEINITSGDLTNDYFPIEYDGIKLGRILFNDEIDGYKYGAEVRLDMDENLERPKPTDMSNDLIVYYINGNYYTPSDKIYIKYDYVPDLYLEYYGYTNTYIEKANLTGYYVNPDTVVKFNADDDPYGAGKPRYALDYYFATGKFLVEPNTTKDKIIIEDLKLYMAFDNNGSPGDWHRIVPDYDINHNIGGEFEYSIGPQHSWGYPLYASYMDNNVEINKGLELIDENTSLADQQRILNEQLAYFQDSILTETIWYKLECDNYNTIISSGEVTITDIPISRLTTITDETTGNMSYDTTEDTNAQSEAVVDEPFPIIRGKLEENTFYIKNSNDDWLPIIPETDTYYDDIEVSPNKRYIWSGSQYIEVIMSDESESEPESIIEGYYYSDKFYSDSAHTKEITPRIEITYVDFPTGNEYIWNGIAYVAKNN